LRRVGLLGGAFDPPHGGHLKLAALAFAGLDLDELRFVPARRSPLKSAPAAPAEARLAMLREMLRGTPYAIETIELEGGRGTAGAPSSGCSPADAPSSGCGTASAPSYTVGTLEALSGREPDAAWILVMGMDQALAFGDWRDPGRILELASIAVAPRPGAPAAAALPDVLAPRLSSEWLGTPGQAVLLPGTDTDASSSRLRRLIASAKAPRGLEADGLPEKVGAVISEKNLYS
jgi:nicotinate-nucleotide adenylyltransferase